MKFLILALALFSPLAAHATEHRFNGTWTGSGYIDSSEGSTKAAFELTINQTEEKLVIDECWFDPTDKARKSCIHSDYELRNGFEIWVDGRRIGQAYNTVINLLQSEPQVAEQMIFELSLDGTLSYRYGYMNIDGASVNRKASLELKTPAL